MVITDDQVMEALEKHGSNARASAALGVNIRTVERRRALLAKQGWSPKHGLREPYPDGFTMGKVTIQRNGLGTIVNTWERMCADNERLGEIVREVLDSLLKQTPKEKPIKAPKQAPDGLLNCYVITDYHMGMLAWGEETGADWDTQIAEDMLVAWFRQAMAEAPDTEVGVFAQLGDFLHWDGWDAVTPASKHLLDADTRFPKLARVAIRAVRRIIRMLLQKHLQVRVIMAEGNHDPTSSVWLRELCAAMYEDEPRVIVDIRPDPYYCVEWGKQLLLFHHGHKRKPTNIDSVFVAKFREEFGRTEFATAHMGHLHHTLQLETNLMTVEQHRTLASPDAYASRGGWMSGRDAKVITYDRNYGERARRIIPAQLITDALARAA